MWAKTLEFISCPKCGGGLTLVAEPLEDGYIEKGFLRCEHCDSVYPITDGVARLLPTAEDTEWTAETRRLQPPVFTDINEDDANDLVESTSVDYKIWKGKHALSVGIFTGRMALCALHLGSEVVVLEESDRILALADTARKNKKLHLVQGHYRRPPIRRETMDIVYSAGTLSASPHLYEDVASLSACVRCGGRLSVWLYRHMSRADYNVFAAAHGGFARFIYRFFIGLRAGAVSFAQKLGRWAVDALAWQFSIFGGLGCCCLLSFSHHRDFEVRLAENLVWMDKLLGRSPEAPELGRWAGKLGFAAEKTIADARYARSGIVVRRD